MGKLRFLVFLVALVLVFPVMVLAGEDEGTPNLECGAIESSDLGDSALTPLKDKRVLDLENEYTARLQSLYEQIQYETSTLAREELQKEVHKVKVEQEIEVKELYLEIAAENGDDAPVIEIQEVLDQLYEPKHATPSAQGPQQVPGGKGNKADVPHNKSPDDL